MVEYFLPILRGLGTGFIMSLMLGTVFFSLIQNSIQRGYRSGFLIALGVIISDVIFIAIALFGTQYIPGMNNYQHEMKMVGGTLLIILGISQLAKKHVEISYPKTGIGGAFYYLGQGFILNVANPVNFFFWVALVATNTTMGYDISQNVVYFIACLSSVYITEMFISYSAHRIKHILNEKFMIWLNRITGTVFTIFGLKLLFYWLPDAILMALRMQGFRF